MWQPNFLPIAVFYDRIDEIDLYEKGENGLFESEFCTVTFAAPEHAVVVQWKKACCGEDYRKPVRHALRLAQVHKGCALIIDARNGFEDEPEDVAWGFTEFIPQLAQAGCTRVVTILDETNDIEDEMDLWTKEFQNYFKVDRTTSYEGAADLLRVSVTDPGENG